MQGKPKVSLEGCLINPFVMIVRACRALHEAGAGDEEIDEFREKCRWNEVKAYLTSEVPSELIQHVRAAIERHCDTGSENCWNDALRLVTRHSSNGRASR